MNSFEIQKLSRGDFPPLLSEITDPPETLFMRGKLPSTEYKWLAVVGSRKYSSYGKETCQKLINGLSGYPIAIVSGLALGIDSLAHKSALEAGLPTVAVPGSGLNDSVLYPKSNFRLAKEILSSGGALLSEYEPDFEAAPWSFPKRNRIMAGMSHATLVIEAGEKSGTLITARLAMEYNRDVLTVPGPIFSGSHKGSNALIKDGAHVVTSAQEILEVLDIPVESSKSKVESQNLSEEEKQVVQILEVEALPKDELIRELGISTTEANILLSAMEIKGLVKETQGKVSLK